MSEQTPNLETLQQLIDQARAQAAQTTPAPEVDMAAASPAPVTVEATQGPSLTPSAGQVAPVTREEFDQLVRILNGLASSVNAGRSPVNVYTEPGSPAEAALAKALDAGALFHFDVTTRDGVIVRAYGYADGTVRPS